LLRDTASGICEKHFTPFVATPLQNALHFGHCGVGGGGGAGGTGMAPAAGVFGGGGGGWEPRGNT